MDQTIKALGGQVFGLMTRGSDGRIQSQAQGIVEQTTIYCWPNEDIEGDVKLTVLAVLTAAGKSEDPSPSRWATFLFSYINLCFPEMRQAINATGTREYRFAELPKDVITACTRLGRAAGELADEEDDNYRNARQSMVMPGQFPDTESTSHFFPADLFLAATVPAVYGYCALLIFMAGKRINEKNRSSITEKRPENIMAAHNVLEGKFILTGEGKMTAHAHGMINRAWGVHAKARQGIITEVAAFGSGATLPQRVVYTISKMLEYSGMQPAYYINKFLLAFPWAYKVASVRPAMEAYLQSLREVAAAPAHIQPYYKVIYGDSTRAFHRNAILNLSACAIAYERHVTGSMGNFVLGEGASAAVAMFDAEAAKLGETTIGELRLQELKEEEED